MIDPDIRASAERDGFLTKFENGEEAVGEGYRKGYAAGAESMKSEPTWDVGAGPFTVENITIDTRYQFEQKLEAERARSAELIEVCKSLLTKLETVHDAPEYKAVWDLAMLHQGPYTGPAYGLELLKLNNAVSNYETSRD